MNTYWVKTWLEQGGVEWQWSCQHVNSELVPETAKDSYVTVTTTSTESTNQRECEVLYTLLHNSISTFSPALIEVEKLKCQWTIFQLATV